MVALDRFKVIAVVGIENSEINEEFLKNHEEGRDWLKSGKKSGAIVLEDNVGEIEVHVTDLSPRTIESRLQDEYYPNI